MEGDLAAHGRGQHSGPLGVAHILGGVEHAEDALGRGHGGLKDGVALGQVADRLEGALGVEHEGREHAQGRPARQHALAAPPEQRRRADRRHHLYRGHEDSEDQQRAHVGRHIGLAQLHKVATAGALAPEQLRHQDAADLLVQVGVDHREPLAHQAVGGAHVALVDHHND